MHFPSRHPAVPAKAKSGPRIDGKPRERKDVGGIEPAGCCVEVCTPFGCKCVLDLPVCP
jgi:hypothetical protein